MVLVRASPQPKIERVGSISHGTSFIYRGITHAYELEKVFTSWPYARNSIGIVLKGFLLLLIEMDLAHFLKHDPLSILALALNQFHPPTITI